MNIEGTKYRIAHYLECMGIGKTQFYNEIGIKRGLLDTDKMNATVSDVVIAKIIATYKDLSPDWLLTGQGPMTRQLVEVDNSEMCDRLSYIIGLIGDVEEVATCLEVSMLELLDFTNNNVYPHKAFKLEGLVAKYPEISYKWLAKGEGNRFNSINPENVIKQRVESYAQTKSVIKSFQESQEVMQKIIQEQSESIGKLKEQLDRNLFSFKLK